MFGWNIVKTTLELPDALLKAAKSLAAQEGITLKSLFTQALQDEVEHLSQRNTTHQPWRKHFGGMKDLHEENIKMQNEIDKEFNKVDDEIWR